MGNPLITLRRTFISTLILGLLAGCAATPPAPIQKAQKSTNDTGNNGSYSNTYPVESAPQLERVGDNNTGWNASHANNQNQTTISQSNQSKVYQNMSDTTDRNTVNASMNGGATIKGSAVPNRDYTTIEKGSFNGNKYVVNRGDTLFYIAWISGNDYRELASKNNISEPFHLTVGQVLDVGNGVNNKISHSENVTASSNISQSGSSQMNHNPDKMNKQPTTSPTSQQTASESQGQKQSSVVSSTVSKINWLWPTSGKVIDSFSASAGGNKGIDIAGNKGQAITSAADGKVVYAGNALRGYGNLIIVKHNDDYLSAYAHNDTMLVSEQQDVKAGQKIATMGNTGASSVRLHFEVRYKGKSVNPLQFLPQR